MNKRIAKKVYKRAEKKLLTCRTPQEKRSTLQVELEDCVLSSLERKVFLKEQYRRIRLLTEIKESLIQEGKWE